MKSEQNWIIRTAKLCWTVSKTRISIIFHYFKKIQSKLRITPARVFLMGHFAPVTYERRWRLAGQGVTDYSLPFDYRMAGALPYSAAHALSKLSVFLSPSLNSFQNLKILPCICFVCFLWYLTSFPPESSSIWRSTLAASRCSSTTKR